MAVADAKQTEIIAIKNPVPQRMVSVYGAISFVSFVWKKDDD